MTNACRGHEVEWIVRPQANSQKLGIDLAGPFRLRDHMNDEAERERRSDQIARTFALLTAKLEDAAALAVEGQGKRSEQEIGKLAQQIAELAGEVTVVSGLLGVLLASPPSRPIQR